MDTTIEREIASAFAAKDYDTARRLVAQMASDMHAGDRLPSEHGSVRMSRTERSMVAVSVMRLPDTHGDEYQVTIGRIAPRELGGAVYPIDGLAVVATVRAESLIEAERIADGMARLVGWHID